MRSSWSTRGPRMAPRPRPGPPARWWCPRTTSPGACRRCTARATRCGPGWPWPQVTSSCSSMPTSSRSIRFVTGLLGPLLTDPAISFVKGFYHRPLTSGGYSEPDGGGRVTELLARPLVNLFWPDLAGFVQPLAGEAAGRREVLDRVPFVSGYGVEIAMLVDLLGLAGLDALAQVDLGERTHRNQSNEALGQMAAQILLTAWSRLARQGRADASTPLPSVLTQFRRGGEQPLPSLGREIVVSDVSIAERPPLITVDLPQPVSRTAAR